MVGGVSRTHTGQHTSMPPHRVAVATQLPRQCDCPNCQTPSKPAPPPFALTQANQANQPQVLIAEPLMKLVVSPNTEPVAHHKTIPVPLLHWQEEVKASQARAFTKHCGQHGITLNSAKFMFLADTVKYARNISMQFIFSQHPMFNITDIGS